MSCLCSGRLCSLCRYVSLPIRPARPAQGWGERQGQQRHQGEPTVSVLGITQGRHHQDPAEDAQATRLASSPGQEAGGVHDASQLSPGNPLSSGVRYTGWQTTVQRW